MVDLRGKSVGVLLLLSLMVANAAFADETLKYSLQNADRTAFLHRPAATLDHSAPLMIVLHGLGDNGADTAKWIGFDAVADREGFVTVYPDAMEGKWSYGRPIIGPMPKIGDQTVDDVGFIRHLIDDLVARKIADPSRIYVTGESRGGLMAFTVACTFADRIAAAAPMITGMTDHQIEDCHPKRPLPLLLIAATKDNSQIYDGWLYENGRLTSVPETLEYWRRLDGCTGEEAKRLPHLNKEDHTRVDVINWTGCQTVTDIRFYRVEDGGHQVPQLVSGSNPMREEKSRRNRDIESAEEIWGFVKQYVLPSP